MRPASIKKFEYLYLAAWGVSLVVALMSWDTDAILASQLGRKLGLAPFAAIVLTGLLIPLALAYFTARRRSNVARWIIVALFTLQAAILLFSLARGSLNIGVMEGLTVMALFLRAIAVRYLFGSEARQWFASVSEVDSPESPLKETA